MESSAGMVTLRTFEVDFTHEVGDYVCGGLQERSIATESALLLRGLILEQDGQRTVIAAIDYCYTVGNLTKGWKVHWQRGQGRLSSK